MARPQSETRQRIQDVARELFTQKGVQRTSLQDIATRLGITKPALYYHFSSREELVRSILQPLIDEWENFVAEHVNWVMRNTDFIKSINTPAKARVYVNEHFPE